MYLKKAVFLEITLSRKGLITIHLLKIDFSDYSCFVKARFWVFLKKSSLADCCNFTVKILRKSWKSAKQSCYWLISILQQLQFIEIQAVPWHSGSYRVWIHSETRTWHDNNIHSKFSLCLKKRSVCYFFDVNCR